MAYMKNCSSQVWFTVHMTRAPEVD